MSCRQRSRPFSTIQQGNRVRKLFLICPQTINKLLHKKGYSYQSIYSFEQCWIVGPHGVGHLEHINLHETQPDNDPEYQDGEEGIIMRTATTPRTRIRVDMPASNTCIETMKIYLSRDNR